MSSPTNYISSENVSALLTKVRNKRSLIHNITNYVVTNWSANVLLAIGASPLMAHAPEEMEDISKLSNALVLNIGTLDKNQIESMKLAQSFALKQNKPVVLDPVGAGASVFRTETAKELLERGVSILRGNASEIMALVDKTIESKGVDSTAESKSALDAAKELSKKYNCVVSISGETDFVVGFGKLLKSTHGSPMLTKVTGTGCASTALTGAFAAVCDDFLLAAAAAGFVMNLAAEKAEKFSNGPGSFAVALLDEIYSLERVDFDFLHCSIEYYC